MRVLSRISSVLLLALICTAFVSDRAQWQSGRIYEIRKSVESKPLYWIANTPVTRDEVTYRITVQLGEDLLTGIYTADRSNSVPPNEWDRGRAVKVQLAHDDMFLKSLAGDDIKLRIVKRKKGTMMQPVTDAELAAAYAPAASPTEPTTGTPESVAKSKAGEESGNPEPAEEDTTKVKTSQGPVGVIDVTTVPYLAEIYIDGASVGYSPAKFTLPVGKHVVRAQKNGYQAWSKDITVLESSEFTVYAELKKK